MKLDEEMMAIDKGVLTIYESYQIKVRAAESTKEYRGDLV